MLCSISTPKSNSNWLDRLRTSKGFPTPVDLDLEQFLNSNPSPNPNPSSLSLPLPETVASDLPVGKSSSEKPSLSQRQEKNKKKIGDEKEQLFDLMSNVLAELFIMGDPQDLPAVRTLTERKSARKQLNPKSCVPSASGSVDGGFSPEAEADRGAPAMSPSSADNSVAEAKKRRTKPRRKRGRGVPVDSDLSAYSRTEVTVIDTSSPSWKSEKLIFRKGTVWKVRDKKMWNASRKKRKLGLVERLIGEKEREQPVIYLKAPARREHLTPDKGGTYTGKREDSKEMAEQIQVPRRRPKFSRSPRVPAAKDSSVFHLKVNTTNRKNGASGHRSTLKGK